MAESNLDSMGPKDESKEMQEKLKQNMDDASKKIENQTVVKKMAMQNILENFKKVKIRSLNSDDEGETHIIPYDKWFRLIDKCMGSAEFGKDAEVVTMEDRMKDAAPYNIFYTTLELCPETKDQLYSISFTDLLCPSFGKLKCSLHVTCIADIEWLLVQFAQRKLHKKPMTLIYGYKATQWPQKETLQELYPDLDYHLINVKKNEGDLGWHHAKMSIFVYEDDSLRVVIGSPDLYEPEWLKYNEEVWISPPCPKLPEGSTVLSGASPTGFKFALLDFLSSYGPYNIPSVEQWMERVKNADFSEVKVSLVFTAPGVHYPRKNGSFVHFLGHLLSRDCTIPAPKEEHNSWTIVALTSAMGLIGNNPDDWLTTHLLKSLGSHKDDPYLATLWAKSKVKFRLVFPTVQNVLDGYPGQSRINTYDPDVKKQQPWLLKYSCQWKADGTKRSRAISNSKCVCRISPCCEKMAYYFLSGANLARSSWGKIPNRDSGIYVRSFEMGLLFLPKYFGEEYFEVKDTPNRKNKRLFPLMFDLPLVPYGPEDDSFCLSELIEKGLLADDSDSDDSQESESKADAVTRSKEKSESTEICAGAAKMTARNTNSAKTDVPLKKDLLVNANSSNLFFPSFKKST